MKDYWEQELKKVLEDSTSTNVNQISKEMIADAYIEWVKADREHQQAREALWREDFAHIGTRDELDYKEEFRTPNKPRRTEKDKIDELSRTLTYQNKVYDTLIEMTDLYLQN